VRLRRAREYQDAGDFEAALAEYRAAIALDPRNAEARSGMGVALLRSGRFDAAGQVFLEALEQDPRNVEVMVNLALSMKARRLLTEARRTLEQAVALDGRNARAHYNLALLHDEAGDRAAAVTHYGAFLANAATSDADLADDVRRRLAVLQGGR
jgi:Flp pilus assembly protein TadD